MMRRRNYSEEGRSIDPGGSGPGGGFPRARAFGGPGAPGPTGPASPDNGGIDAQLADIIGELRRLAASLGNVAEAQQELSQAALHIGRARQAARRSGRS